MPELACGGLILIILIVVSLAAAGTRKAAAAALAERRERAIRLTVLLERLPSAGASDRIFAEIARLLESEPPVGFLPELVGDQGWFSRSRTGLTVLWTSQSEYLVEAYFRFFTFAAGQQSIVLSWLAELLAAPHSAGTRETLERIATRVAASGSGAEAEWLYFRALDAVAVSGGEPASKLTALALGRISYSLGRPARQPTMYDEQAIANDIAVRSRPQALN